VLERAVAVNNSEKSEKSTEFRSAGSVLLQILKSVFASFALGFGLCLLLFSIFIFIIGHEAAEALMHPVTVLIAAVIGFPFIYKNIK
jgi:hypothetical protein